MKKKQQPIITDPFGSYTGVVRFPDRVNPGQKASLHFPRGVNPVGKQRPLPYPMQTNPHGDGQPLRFPQAENPVQDADDL